MLFKASSACLLVAGLVTAQPATISHVKPLPGKCTIGIEVRGASFPQGNPTQGGAGTVNLHGAWGFIVGTDGVMTKIDAPWEGHITSDGNYGGIGGGDWHAEGNLSGPSSVAHCKITFRGQTFDADSVDKETCDYYNDNGAFTNTGGCRCRFDCQ